MEVSRNTANSLFEKPFPAEPPSAPGQKILGPQGKCRRPGFAILGGLAAFALGACLFEEEGKAPRPAAALEIRFETEALKSGSKTPGRAAKSQEKALAGLGRGTGPQAKQAAAFFPDPRAGTEAEALPAFDSVELRVSGEGMEPRTFSAAKAGGAREGLSFPFGSLHDLPAGENRIFEARLFERSRLLYRGRTVIDLKAGSNPALVLTCRPLFSRLHLPLDLGPLRMAGVRGGRLRLTAAGDSLTDTLQAPGGEAGYFRLSTVLGGLSYRLRATLVDAEGRPVFEGSAEVTLPAGRDTALSLSFERAGPAGGLRMEWDKAPEARVSALFPSAKRAPLAYGEVVVSELLIAPAAADSGAEGEWVEFRNRSLDTLDLSSCALSRDGRTGAAYRLELAPLGALPPGESRAFGRKHAPTSLRYASFSLTDRVTDLTLRCAEGLLLDSLRYGPAADSAAGVLPFKAGRATVLDPRRLGARENPQHWCLSASGATAESLGGGGAETPASAAAPGEAKGVEPASAAGPGEGPARSPGRENGLCPDAAAGEG